MYYKKLSYTIKCRSDAYRLSANDRLYRDQDNGTTAHDGHEYAVAAIKYGVKPKSVMRNITYALDHVTDLASRLSEILGFTVDDNSLHNGRVIFYIADLITEPSLFDFSA